jgi:DNA-binding NarL/FixJ family response regulator
MKVLMVDDHVLIREALRGVLLELKGDVTVLEASGCVPAAKLIAEHPDIELVLLDLNLPDGDGFATLGELRDNHPAISVVVLSGMQDRATVMHALDRGALGFIPKTATRAVMLSALQLVFSGGIYVPPEILARDVTPPLQPDQKRPLIEAGTASDLGLTARQIDVLALMMLGKSNKAICRLLDLAEPTVKNHVTAILKALKVTNRTEAVIAARERGWDLQPTVKS